MFPIDHPPSLPGLDSMLHSAFLAIYEAVPDLDGTLLKMVQAAVAEKTGAFTGELLLEQFDKNAIYNSESTWNLARAAADYLCRGEALFTELSASKTSLMLLRLQGQPAMEAHLAYVRNGCRGCGSHLDHGRYENMRKNRQTLPPSRYREESELSYRWTLVSVQLAEFLAKINLLNPRVALAFPSTPVPAATQLIYSHIFRRTVLWWALNGPKKQVAAGLQEPPTAPRGRR